MDTELFFREHGYYPTTSDPHVNTNIPQTDAEREQFFHEHGYYFCRYEPRRRFPRQRPEVARYIPLPTPEAKQRWENSELKRGYERMVKEHVDRILDGWARERDDQELIAMNGKKRGKCYGRNKRPVLVFDNFVWKLGPLTHCPLMGKSKEKSKLPQLDS